MKYKFKKHKHYHSFDQNQFKHLDNRLKTFNKCIEALTNNITNFKHLPVQYQTEDFIIELFKKYYDNISFTFIKKHGDPLSAIPKRLITRKIVEVSLKHSIASAKYIPVGIISEKFIIDNIKIVKHLNRKLFTQKISNCAVNYNPDFIEYIPKKYKSEEICNLAVHYKPNNIIYIPKYFRTYELLLKCKHFSTYAIRSYFDIDKFTNDQKEYLQLLNII